MRVLPIVIGSGVLLGIIIMTQKKANASPPDTTITDTSLDVLFKKWAAIYKTDWRLLKAHAVVESNLRADAVNRSDPSYGVMQILCTNAGRTCTNKFNIEGWPEMTAARLLDADTNIRMGAQIVAWNQRQYGLMRGIAVYNSWDQRNAPAIGPFKNKAYVDKVVRVYTSLGGMI